MATILLTGFVPFGDNQTNPSGQIAERLNGQAIGGARVVGRTLPVALGEEADLLTAAIADVRPSLVLSLGLAVGATCLEVERFAVNLGVAEPGEAGKPLEPDRPQIPIVADGLAALLVTVDAERVARAIREKAGVPARAHGYAGSYACNFVLYHALHYAMQWDLNYRAGFIHLPLSSEQAISENKMHLPSLPLDVMERGIVAALEEAQL